MKELGGLTILIGIFNLIKNYSNGIRILISLELLFIGISFLFLQCGLDFDDLQFVIFFFFLLLLSAIETTIGLTFLLNIKTPSLPLSSF